MKGLWHANGGTRHAVPVIWWYRLLCTIVFDPRTDYRFSDDAYVEHACDENIMHVPKRESI